MNEKEDIKKKASALLKLKKFAVLSTYGDGQPYANLVAFSESPDLTCVFFATERKTRKYKNLMSHPRAALLIENTVNAESDLRDAGVLTLTGPAELVGENDRAAIIAQYAAKHPYLRDFVQGPDCAVIRIRVENWIWVENFKTVINLVCQL